jgi:uncharacterized caspase-like protein
MSRIAIVIGVNKPRAPAPLKGAVSDAAAFAVWIEKQGFETTSFVDDHKPVTLASIFAEVERVVNLGTYSQMVIYFAGHGLQNGGSEVWLLSGAPDNPGEAISVEASVMAARESGLTSVVFISDACRSIPNNLQSSRLDGKKTPARSGWRSRQGIHTSLKIPSTRTTCAKKPTVKAAVRNTGRPSV